MEPDDTPLIDDPVVRQRLQFSRVEIDGEPALRVAVWLDPGGGVPPHVHPSTDERFEVLAGNPSFYHHGHWHTLGPGEQVSIPAGEAHAYRNRGRDLVEMIGYVSPPEDMQEFLEATAALGRTGKFGLRLNFPKSFDALVQGAAMVEHYRTTAIVLFPPLPPPPLQRMFVPLLASLGRRRGYWAGSSSSS